MNSDLVSALTILLSLILVIGGLYKIMETKDEKCNDDICECC